MTGYEIMHPRDISGHNHMLLVDGTFQSDDYYLVKGCFTSTNKPINGIKPEKISDYPFNGTKKDQYYLPYPEPKLILNTLVKTAKFDVFESMHSHLQTSDHTKFKNSLTPTDKDPY